MTVLVDYQIRELCEEGLVEPYDPALINPASLDIRIGNNAQIRMGKWGWIRYWWMKSIKKYKVCIVVDKGGRRWIGIDLICFDKHNPLLMRVGDRVLVSSLETINIPNHVCAQFRLKSSRGREFYEHMEAGFCDPGWTGSKLTMEIVNLDLFPLPLYPGLRMGQMVFQNLAGIPERDYSETGRYNNDASVQGSKG